VDFVLFILRRLVMIVATLFVLSLIIFVLLRAIPGDPTTLLAGLSGGATATQVATIKAELGLTQPMPEQYWIWLTYVLRGSFGTSYFSDVSANSLIATRIGPTFELVLAAVVLAVVIAVPTAIACALKPHSRRDNAIVTVSTLGIALPVAWLGLLLIVAFAVKLNWFPTRGYVSIVSQPIEGLRYLVLPAVTLSVGVAAPLVRFLRSSLFDELGADYFLAARGKGLRYRSALVRHALPNSVIPSLNFLGIVAGSLLGGVVVVEFVFGWPGLGSLALTAVQERDYVVLQAVVLLAAAAFMVTSLIVDVLSRLLDPSLREHAAR
jgi:peptide/nickel transport system permease protein